MIEHFCEVENGATHESGIAPVTNMYDRWGKPTDDPHLAISCVVHLPNGTFVATPTEGFIIGAKH